MESFRNIGIVGREGNGVAETLQRLVCFLQSRGLTVVLGEQIAPLMPNHALRV
ncbi:MAG: NAD+ kinase, partial [Paracoccaceae bacterium]